MSNNLLHNHWWIGRPTLSPIGQCCRHNEKQPIRAQHDTMSTNSTGDQKNCRFNFSLLETIASEGSEIILVTAMEDVRHPLDMSQKNCNISESSYPPSHPSRTSPPSSPPGVSPPPLTKIVRKPPSTPREFFAKLYEPDTVTHNNYSKERESSPQNEEKSFLPLSPPVPSLPYLPNYPLPPQELGMVTLENINIAFPPGLAAFCK